MSYRTKNRRNEESNTGQDRVCGVLGAITVSAQDTIWNESKWFKWVIVNCNQRYSIPKLRFLIREIWDIYQTWDIWDIIILNMSGLIVFLQDWQDSEPLDVVVGFIIQISDKDYNISNLNPSWLVQIT